MDAAELHDRVSELFLAACELSVEERAAWLERATEGDVLLKREVESLLALDTAPALIDPPALGSHFRGADPEGIVIGAVGADDLGPLPERIGQFAIKRRLGHGGMGVVYLAEQGRPHRQVAIKVLRAGAASGSVLRRFEFEADVLARLQHPGIAQVYEAGTVKDSDKCQVPYFAMEVIHGAPLTEHARERNLDTRERLDLVARICDAVHHAHQKGVIHRDLKPGNILVDESGQPKVLDFGVARATNSEAQATMQRTDVGQLIGTLAYMSPEQVGGKPNELDTGADVYALGVIAYELLAGKLPFELSEWPIHEAARAIREDDPARLSSIDRSLRGDIENIIAKAMEKDKTRRYLSAEALASDIRRHLRDEPIEAHPPSTWYQAAKFARRNKALVYGVIATVVVLIGGLAGTLWQAQKAAARAEAESKARRRAEAMNDFVKEALAWSDAEQGGKQDTSVVDAMTNALKKLDAGSLEDDPETEADLRSSIATILMNNGRVREAEALNAQVLEMYKRLYKGDHAKVATAMNDLAAIRFLLGRPAEVEPLILEALEMNKRLYKGDHFEVAASLNNLAIVRQGLSRAAESEPIFVQVLEMNRRLYKGDHEEVATSLNNLANVLDALNRGGEAEPLYEQALAMTQRLVKGDHPDVARGLNNLALLRASLGRAAEAEPLFVQALDMYRRLYKGDHPAVATALNNVAFVRKELGRVAESEPGYEEAFEMNKRLFDEDHPQVALSAGNLALLRRDLGRTSEAEPLARQSLEMYERIYAGDHDDVANSLNTLALILRDLGRESESEILHVQAMEMSQRLHEGDHESVARTLNGVASVRLALNRPTEAEPLFERSLEMYQRLYKGDNADVALGLADLARVHHALGKNTVARTLFNDAVAMSRRLVPDGSTLLARVLWRSATALLEGGDAAAALPELKEAVALAERLLPAAHPHLQEYRDTFARCEAALGK